MNQQFGHAGRARREKHPFRGVPIDLDTFRRLRGYTRESMQRDATAALIVRVAIGHDRVHAGLGDQRGKVCGWQVGRANDEATRNPVQFDQRQSRRKLILSCDEHRAARELEEPAAEARAVQEIAQSDAGVGTPEKAAHTDRRAT